MRSGERAVACPHHREGPPRGKSQGKGGFSRVQPGYEWLAVADTGIPYGQGGYAREFGLRQNDFRLRWYDPTATGTTFHQPHDHSEFGCTSRRRLPCPLTSSNAHFFCSNVVLSHVKDISRLLIHILCLKSGGSWSLLVTVLVERSALLPVSTRDRHSRVPWCAKMDMLTKPWCYADI